MESELESELERGDDCGHDKYKGMSTSYDDDMFPERSVAKGRYRQNKTGK